MPFEGNGLPAAEFCGWQREIRSKHMKKIFVLACN